MSNMTVVALNDRLAVASKKFTRACEQITLLKQQIAVYISMFASCNETIHNDLSQNVSREMVRQKIETLQNFKTIFFKYAHQKAEEITKIQVELYARSLILIIIIIILLILSRWELLALLLSYNLLNMTF